MLDRKRENKWVAQSGFHSTAPSPPRGQTLIEYPGASFYKPWAPFVPVARGMIKLNSLQDLLVFEINDLLGAEKQLSQVFAKVIHSARHTALREALEAHQRETAVQESRLEQCLQSLGSSVKPARSHGMVGIVSVWMEQMEAEAHPDVRDAATIGVLQRATHYEIAGYGCAHAFARQLEKQTVASLLKQTLLEEEEFDRKLTKIAESVVNRDACLYVS